MVTRTNPEPVTQSTSKKSYWAKKLEGPSTITSNTSSITVLDMTTSLGQATEDLSFTIGILIESDSKLCFELKNVVKLQEQHRHVKKCIPFKDGPVNLNSFVSDDVRKAWMLRNKVDNDDFLSYCLYKPASRNNKDRNLVTVTESSNTATPGKPIGFSSCGKLFSNEFTMKDLREIVIKLNTREPQLYLGICTTFFNPLDLSSPKKIGSPNSFKHQTRALVKREGDNILYCLLFFHNVYFIEEQGFAVLSSPDSIINEDDSEEDCTE